MKQFKYKGKIYRVNISYDSYYSNAEITLYSKYYQRGFWDNIRALFSKSNDGYKRCFYREFKDRSFEFTDYHVRNYIERTIEKYLFTSPGEVQDYNEKFNLTPNYDKELIKMKEDNIKLLKQNEELSNEICEYKKRLDNIQNNNKFLDDFGSE